MGVKTDALPLIYNGNMLASAELANQCPPLLDLHHDTYVSAVSRMSKPRIVRFLTGASIVPVTLKRTLVCVATNCSSPVGVDVPLK